jgi:hypothetical protein
MPAEPHLDCCRQQERTVGRRNWEMLSEGSELFADSIEPTAAKGAAECGADIVQGCI